MLKKHYAPKTPLLVTSNHRNLLLENSGKKVGVLTFAKIKENTENEIYKSLTQNESLTEAAASLYATLIELDALALDLIIAEYVPNKGIGKAINDRLRRASYL
jgi:L-threonylcarbamoyladenylate synthase